jgi:DNA-binding transcriptional MerR regulator
MYPNSLIDTAAVAEKLGVSEHTVRAWTRQGLIPHVPLSPRVIRYDPAKIDDWLNERAVQVAA